MDMTDAGVQLFSQQAGCAHFLGYGFRQIDSALAVFFHDCVEKFDPLRYRAARPCRECSARGPYRPVNIG